MNQPHTVETLMNYSDAGETPIGYWFYEPDPADRIELRPAGQDRHVVRVEDAWPIVDSVSVDAEGFELHGIDDGFRDFENEASVERDFYPVAVDFVKRHTGANRVVVFDHTLRRRRSSDIRTQTTTERSIPFAVHSDFTPNSGPQRVRDIMGDEAEALLDRRVAFFNVWKPLYDTVEELPLGVCDARSVAPEEMLIMHLKYADRDGEIYTMSHAPGHRWYYFPKMRTDQALLLKTYDSATDGRSRFNVHSAFADPDTPPDAKPRQSIEVRTMAFF
ncbi:MAG: CmcJ/NvfI family oxidoreductase [Minwuia sp.]|uniref:CmcJ/NvfI family oxidoreductase n=1 Tax=Minwuia sp. TaxID=2493630 RepID=UPI003A841091